MRWQTDDFLESFWNRRTVKRDMTNLAVRQPKFEQQIQG
jgi:hypothetical protein